MMSSLIISIGYLLSKRNYFTAATLHGIGNASLGLIYTVVSLPGSNLAQVVIIALGLMIGIVTLGVFGKQFKARVEQEIQEICANKEKQGMTEVYKDK